MRTIYYILLSKGETDFMGNQMGAWTTYEDTTRESAAQQALADGWAENGWHVVAVFNESEWRNAVGWR